MSNVTLSTFRQKTDYISYCALSLQEDVAYSRYLNVFFIPAFYLVMTLLALFSTAEARTTMSRIKSDNGGRNVRLHLLKMHPFLKHKILSKSMRELLYSSRYHRSKRQDESDELSTHIDKLKNYFDSAKSKHINPIYLALKRNIESINDTQISGVLKQVLQDVEEIEFGKSSKGDVECNISGSWVAEMAGRIIDLGDIKNQKTNASGFRAVIRKHVQKHKTGFMGTDIWNATIRMPFYSKQNYIILTALNRKEKIVATFMGECRVCRQKEIVQGQWLVARHARDCEGLGATEQLIGDVWRKDNILNLKRQRLEMLKHRPRLPKQHNKMESVSSSNVAPADNTSTTMANPLDFTATTVKPSSTKSIRKL